MIIKRNIKFTLKKQQKASSRVILRVTYNGLRLDFQTGIVIKEEYWDAANQCVIVSNSASRLVSEMNDFLNSLRVRMTGVFHRFELLDRMPNKDELRASFNSYDDGSTLQVVVNNSTPCSAKKVVKTESKSGKDDSMKKNAKKKGFFDYLDEFTKVNGKLNDWTKSTYEKFAAMRNHLLGFKKNLTFDAFDENGIADYVEYLSKVKSMKNSTINKQLGFLRWFLRWSYEKGYNKNNTFEYFKPKLKYAQKKVIFLREDEIKKIENFNIPDNHLALGPVRDVFLFCCYTGLRYSDVLRLTWEDVHDGKMEVVTKKTTDRLIIELNHKANNLISKYNGVRLRGNVVFPVIVNQKMNEALHLLFQLAGFDEPVKEIYYKGNQRIEKVRPKYELVTTHCARRTFICLALSKGIPPSVVMKWTGHSDYKAMKPYIDIADEVKEKYMKKFDE